MVSSDVRLNEFVEKLILSCGWEVRYSPTSQPYAALPRGFGNGEMNIKVHFMSVRNTRAAVRAVGVIEFSEKVGIRRPSMMISIYPGIDESARLIKEKFIPRYKAEWYRAQPAIHRWLQEHPST